MPSYPVLSRHLDLSFCLAVGAAGIITTEHELLIKLINHACSFMQHPYCSTSTALREGGHRGPAQEDCWGFQAPLSWPETAILSFPAKLRHYHFYSSLPASVLPTYICFSLQNRREWVFLPQGKHFLPAFCFGAFHITLRRRTGAIIMEVKRPHYFPRAEPSGGKQEV